MLCLYGIIIVTQPSLPLSPLDLSPLLAGQVRKTEGCPASLSPPSWTYNKDANLVEGTSRGAAVVMVSAHHSHNHNWSQVSGELLVVMSLVHVVHIIMQN